MVEAAIPSPGHVLRVTREAKGFALGDIAAKLYLNSQLISALESDDYSYFVAPVYARGYLRSYAVLLGLDSDSLLQRFDESNFSSQVGSLECTSYMPSHVTQVVRLHRSRRRMARWFSVIVFVCLIGLISAWWYGQHHHQHADISPSLLTTTIPQSVTAAVPGVVANQKPLVNQTKEAP